MDETQAIAQMRCGDIGGLEFVVRQYQVRAVRSAYLVTHDLPLAQDVVQAAFIKAWERISQFDPRRPFGPWFYTIVLRDAVKASRRRDQQTSLDGIEEDEPGPNAGVLADARPGPEALREQAETAEEVWAALQRLTPTQRAAVVARYFLDMNEAETAQALTAPVSTIKWRLYAARQRLRLFLHPLATK